MSADTPRVCRYCSGTGQTHPAPIETPRIATVRGAAQGRLPPFGREVEDAVNAGNLPPGGVDIFVRGCLRPRSDVWQLADQGRRLRGAGSAMVLPSGDDPTTYRWPAIPVIWEESPAVVIWTFGCTSDEERAFGEVFIAVGYDVVDVRGGPSGPLRFSAV